MENTKGWVLVIGILLIFALGALGVVLVVRDTVQRTVAPVQSVTDNISTQVANVLHPTPTIIPDPVTIIHSVRDLARLETIQYTVEKVIIAETNQGPFGFLFGDRLILVAHGLVIAGMDMSLMQPQDLEVRQGVLYARLPAPEIFVATLDNQKSYVVNRDTGILTRGDLQLESSARAEAENEIRNAAISDGILKQARLNAENYLTRLFRQLGYADVIFQEATPVPED
jgi:Protein of unknown function (DUF4230)